MIDSTLDPSARTAGRTTLEGRLGSLLGFDDVSDVFEHLISIDTGEDLLDYLSQLLGDDGEEVRHFVEDVGRYQRGEELLHVATVADAGGERQSGYAAAANAKAPQSKQGGGGASSWAQQWERDEQDRREKQTTVDKQQAEALLEEEAERQRALEREKRKKKDEKEVPTQQKPPPQAAIASKPPARNGPAQEQGRNQTVAKQKGGASGVSKKAARKKAEVTGEALEADKKPSPPQRGKAKTVCGCFGTHHKPLTNCLHCGRIACRQEGYGYCPCCGYLIEKVTVTAGKDGKFDKALLHKERLLKFDREFTKRTVVLDDQADYFSNATSAWLEEDEKEDAEERDEERRRKMHEKKKQVLNIGL